MDTSQILREKMKSSRREFIHSTAAAALIGACSSDEKNSLEKNSLQRSPEPAPWEPTEPVDEQIFPYPLRVGDVSDTSVIILRLVEM